MKNTAKKIHYVFTYHTIGTRIRVGGTGYEICTSMPPTRLRVRSKSAIETKKMTFNWLILIVYGFSKLLSKNDTLALSDVFYERRGQRTC